MSYAYDDAGRLAAEMYRHMSDLGDRPSCDYDGHGNLVQFRSYDETLGEVYEAVTYQSDGTGRLTSVSGDCSSGLAAPVVFSYDGLGCLASATATLAETNHTAEVTRGERGNVAQVIGRADASTTSYTPSYTRYFVAEGVAEPIEGIRAIQ